MAVTRVTDIRELSADEMISRFISLGEKPFRARQVYDWLWQKSAGSFEQMTNLSKPLREKLSTHFVIRPVEVEKFQVSSDRTIKSAFRLFDGNVVEGVLIPADNRMTACVSSQVGCSLTCKFCATGRLDRIRNLDAAEIYDQVAIIRRQCETSYQTALTNIVYMGMGEPLLNYSNVLKSVELITSEKGLGMSPKRITVSTAGVAKMIRKLGDLISRFHCTPPTMKSAVPLCPSMNPIPSNRWHLH
jgi:23S rRNA (adenine2503-C2)-methyltransferase